MKLHRITSSLAAVGVAFLLPVSGFAAPAAHAMATHATSAKSATVGKNATAAKGATVAKNATAAKTTSAKSATAAKAEHATLAKNATATKTHTTKAKNASAKKTKIDINNASRDELMTLPGVDGATADKIIEGRPYRNMAQLKTKGGVTNAEYRKISSKVTAHQSNMHSEATPANGTQSTGSEAQSSNGGDAADAGPSSDQTTK